MTTRKPRPEPPADLTAAMGEARTVIMFGVRYDREFFEALRDAGQEGTVTAAKDADGGNRIVVRQKDGTLRPARAPRGTPGSEFFTAAEWFRFSLPLRERWWRETEYSKTAPSPELLRAIEEERKR